MFVDHATRVCLGVVTVSREIQDCKDAILSWMNFAQGPPKVLRSDMESALMADEIAIWMQQHGIEFHPRGKDQKAHLAEAHIRLVRETIHCLDEEARQKGVELPLRELVVLSVGARNNLSEF